MFDRFSGAARYAVFAARIEAGKEGARAICGEHLLLGLMAVDAALFQRLGVTVDAEAVRLHSAERHGAGAPLIDSVDMPVAKELRATFERAALIAEERGFQEIRTEHLLIGLLESEPHAAAILHEHSLETAAVLQVLDGLDRCQEQAPENEAVRRVAESFLRMRGM